MDILNPNTRLNYLTIKKFNESNSVLYNFKILNKLNTLIAELQGKAH